MSDIVSDGTVIDGLLQRYDELTTCLLNQKEISLYLDTELNFKKLLIMACGSYFEEQITSAIDRFATDVGEARLASFVRNKALERQYHTFFDWKGAKNVNTFLGLFGQPFKEAIVKDIHGNETLKAGMCAFLDLGQQRNLLAHGNLAALSITKTVGEITDQYRQAHRFVTYLIAQFIEAPRDATTSPPVLGVSPTEDPPRGTEPS